MVEPLSDNFGPVRHETSWEPLDFAVSGGSNTRLGRFHLQRRALIFVRIPESTVSEFLQFRHNDCQGVCMSISHPDFGLEPDFTIHFDGSGATRIMSESAQDAPKGSKPAVQPTLEATARVRHLMDYWEAEMDRGVSLTAEEICKDDMDIIERVRDQIDSLHAMTRIMSDMTAATESLATNDANYDHSQNPTVTNTFSDLDIVAAQGLGLIPEKPLNQAVESPRLIVGRYYLESFIAQGGHGQVWRAYDPELQRRVALKMTRPERMAKLSAHQRYIEQYRLLEEARKVARLKANGIMTIYDVGIQDPLAFIVCELIDGEDLSHRLRNIKPTFAEAVRLCIEVAEILDIAHQEGFIHRDIKPGNILLEKGGRVVITDFGIAATFNDIDREAGMVVGTPSYMSPEQATGQTDAIATTTDIYSLGVILFEMLTGRLPFENESTPKLLSQIIENDPPKPTSIDPLIPLPLERVCLKALSKTPLDRQHNALEFSDSLRYAALISNIKWEKT